MPFGQSICRSGLRVGYANTDGLDLALAPDLVLVLAARQTRARANKKRNTRRNAGTKRQKGRGSRLLTRPGARAILILSRSPCLISERCNRCNRCSNPWAKPCIMPLANTLAIPGTQNWQQIGEILRKFLCCRRSRRRSRCDNKGQRKSLCAQQFAVYSSVYVFMIIAIRGMEKQPPVPVSISVSVPHRIASDRIAPAADIITGRARTCARLRRQEAQGHAHTAILRLRRGNARADNSRPSRDDNRRDG